MQVNTKCTCWWVVACRRVAWLASSWLLCAGRSISAASDWFALGASILYLLVRAVVLVTSSPLCKTAPPTPTHPPPRAFLSGLCRVFAESSQRSPMLRPGGYSAVRRRTHGGSSWVVAGTALLSTCHCTLDLRPDLGNARRCVLFRSLRASALCEGGSVAVDVDAHPHSHSTAQ